MPWVYTPFLAYLMEANQIVARLEDEGLTLDLTDAQRQSLATAATFDHPDPKVRMVLDLAKATLGPPQRWVDEVPVLTHDQVQALDRIAAERALVPADAQDALSNRPEAIEQGAGARSHRGQCRSSARARSRIGLSGT